MPITSVRTKKISAALHTPFVTALRRTTSLDSLIVEIHDDEGRCGYGEAPQVWQVTGASIDGSAACVQQVLGPLLLGRDPDDLVTLCRDVARAVVGNESAKGAVDVALHDLAAQRLGAPLARMLGGSRLRVDTDVTLAAGEAATLGVAAKQRQEEGFTVLKLKVGTDASTDLDRIRAVCAAAHPATRVRLDANQGWTPREAVRIINRISTEDLPVELVEQPVPAADIDGLAWVSDRVEIPVMADETVFGLRDLTEVIKRRAADLVNVKLAKCGGLSTARTLLDLATAYDLGTCVGSMMEGPIGVGAAASLVAAYPTSVVSDLDAAWWLAESPVDGGPSYSGATLVLSDAPGLGVRGLLEVGSA